MFEHHFWPRCSPHQPLSGQRQVCERSFDSPGDLGLSERAQTWGLDSRGGPFLLATDLREDDAPHSNLHWGRGGPSLGGKHAAGARALQVANGGILAACTSDREARESIGGVKARAVGGNPGTEKAAGGRRGRAHRRERCSGSLRSRRIDFACT